MVRKSPVCTLFVFVVIFKINNEVSMHDEGGGAELTMGLRVDLSGTRAMCPGLGPKIVCKAGSFLFTSADTNWVNLMNIIAIV